MNTVMALCVQVFGPSVAVLGSTTGVGSMVNEVDSLSALLEQIVPICTAPDLPSETAAAYAKLLLVCVGFEKEGPDRQLGVLLQNIAGSGAEGPVDCQQWLQEDQVVTNLEFICVLVEMLSARRGGEQ